MQYCDVCTCALQSERLEKLIAEKTYETDRDRASVRASDQIVKAFKNLINCRAVTGLVGIVYWQDVSLRDLQGRDTSRRNHIVLV